MRGLRDFKVPDFKFPKFKMRDISEIEEMNMSNEEIEKQKEERKKDKKEYVATNYSDIKEIFEYAIKKYSDKEFILEKFDPKGKYEEITYKKFGEDVKSFGTAINKVLELNEKPRIMILSETTYDWYVSYVTSLCIDAIAIPTDKELPENELENVVVKQISVFIENKEGRMKKAINTLAQENINIRALSIADTTKYGILRLIVSDNEKAIEALEKDGFIVRENDVIIVAVPDEPNGLNTTLAIFDEKGINLDYLYAFVSSKTEKAIVVMRLKHMDEAIALLKD